MSKHDNHSDCEKENGKCLHDLDVSSENDESCHCSPDCDCGSDCDCKEGDKCSEDCDCDRSHNCKCEHDCDCDDDCECEDECKCDDDDENCRCKHHDDDHECCHHGEHKKDCHCKHHKEDSGEEEEKPNNYFNDLLRLQAEFDNYRKRMQSALSDARQDGFIDAIENFLPALDSFKMATDMITDKNTLTGIKFIEKGILDTLSKMGVNEIDCSGEFDPNFHQAIDVDTTSDAPPGSIVKVAYKGFTYKGKVIRYAQVIVKK